MPISAQSRGDTNAGLSFILAALLFMFISPFRALPAQFHIPSGNVTALIAAINTANTNGQADVINLEPGVYNLQSIAALDPGGSPRGNGLPVISTSITIKGESDITTIIQRDESAPPFRIFRVEIGGTLTLDHVTITGGQADLGPGGGGIINYGVTNIVSSAVVDNLAGGASGGGIASYGGNATLNITSSLISRNSSDGGDGILSGGILTITNSSISENHHSAAIVTFGPAIIKNSTIAFNSAAMYAPAGIENDYGNLEIINSTIAQNHVDLFGSGAIFNGFGTIRITNSTIADNTSYVLGPAGIAGFTGIVNNGGTVELQNTIVARNKSGERNVCQGEILSAGNNLIDDPIRCPIQVLSSDLVGDPGLGTYKDDEEPGKGYIPLLANSSAINAGNEKACPKRDQLGNKRFGRCDIGAVEFVPDNEYRHNQYRDKNKHDHDNQHRDKKNYDNDRHRDGE